MTFAEYFQILHKRWLVWASGLVLGLAAAVGISLAMPVQYTAEATSFVTVAERVDEGQGEIFQGSQFAVQRVKSYAPLATSHRVLDPVTEELGLDLDHADFADAVEVSSPPETVLLKVQVTDPDPEQAARMADAVSERLGEVIEELETAAGSTVPNVGVSLAQPAEVPTSPSSPRVLLNLLLGGALGLALGLVAAVLRHHLDRRVKTPEDLRDLTGISPLGVTLREPSAYRRPLVALDYRSVSAERYRTIRTALKFATVDRRLEHFVVSSAMAGDGKTSVSSNLAISWAQAGASVCLVEADLRRPGAARFFGVEGSLGLSDVLVGEADLDEVLVSWNRDMLTVLPAGSLPPDPAALLGSEAMHALVESLRERYDVVIYDSPPVLSVTDAVVLGEQVDGVVLVVPAGSARREQTSAALEAFRQARLTLLGTVLSGERRRGGTSKSAYGAEPSVHRAELAPLGTDRKATEAIPSATAPSAAEPVAESVDGPVGEPVRESTGEHAGDPVEESTGDGSGPDQGGDPALGSASHSGSRS
ncbi:polysaccharide biosynthesis tyrosine autokinase [Nocardioides insulae]|uniref:polysaccharide biosynthesis tyrosine autokinase n=1 Tax=Nocardioides insulae TaxID=394734 RepID=UPI000428B8A0|nr:polysaccharide biosynthesis tyrosine autokinase [Nocardioides insulae]